MENTNTKRELPTSKAATRLAPTGLQYPESVSGSESKLALVLWVLISASIYMVSQRNKQRTVA